jgi:heterotetrameric sarcosine oxidase delta subunit
MLLIPCPHCGPRDEGEFAYGGPLRHLPPMDGVADAAAWHRALHLGANPRGPLTELWYHASGCETWIAVTRDTTTHDFVEAPAPRGKGGGA